MKKLIIIFCILLGNMARGQHTAQKIRINETPRLCTIQQGEEQSYELILKKDILYTITVNQQGIDLVVLLKDKSRKVLEEKDSPNGQNGPEKISFSPDSAGVYSVSVKPLTEKGNAVKGSYSIQVQTVPQQQKRYSLKALQEDFDILTNAYIECKVGLWHNSYAAFDSFCHVQRNKLRNNQTALDLYRILAPVTAFTKEGHSSIGMSDETATYLRQYGNYFPFFVKIIDKKIYALNNVDDFSSTGMIISRINGHSADSILDLFTTIEPADGYNYTSKYRWIESSFSKYYLRFFGSAPLFTIEFADPDSGKKTIHTVPSLPFKVFNRQSTAFRRSHPAYFFDTPLTLTIDSLKQYAVLTINDFGSKEYPGRLKGFAKMLDSIFLLINKKMVKNLVIDIRKNEGGTQGMEDLLLSHLIAKNYQKYDYVEIPGFSYSFLPHTDYKNEADILKKELEEEFYQSKDGRYINRKGFYDGLPPSNIHFSGKVFILISGLTFSGGSEFAALAKNYTNAIFIGEETGGLYYGNTSGSFLKFELPNTKITGRIPLVKFVVTTKETSIPFGRGIMPDHTIQPTISELLNNDDVELKLALKLMNDQ